MAGSRGSDAAHLRLVPTEPADLHQFVQEVGGTRAALTAAPWGNPHRRSLPVSYVIRLELESVSTRIWRRIVVPSDLALDQLHPIVQNAMGWGDRYPHSWGRSAGGGTDGFEECSARRLDDILVRPGDRVEYRYGRLGKWRHTVVLESSEERADSSPVVCLAGRSACPPEDCAGPDEYEQLLGVLASETLRSREWTLEWPDTTFEPLRFDLAEVNSRLSHAHIRPRPEQFSGSFDLTVLIECLRQQDVPELTLVLGRASVDDRREIPHEVHVQAGARLRSLLALVGVDGMDADQFHVAVDAMFDEPELGPVNLPKARSLFTVLRRLGLVRKWQGRVVLTKKGRGAQCDARALWQHIVDGVPIAHEGIQRAVEMLVLVAVAAGLSPSDRHHFVSGALEPIRSSRILMATTLSPAKRHACDSTVEVLGLIGATGHDLGRFGSKPDSLWAPSLARAVLQR